MGAQCEDDGCVNEWVPASCTAQTFASVLATLRLDGTENPAMRPAVKIIGGSREVILHVPARFYRESLRNDIPRERGE
jgi:hypothetical protein